MLDHFCTEAITPDPTFDCHVAPTTKTSPNKSAKESITAKYTAQQVSLFTLSHTHTQSIFVKSVQW